MGDKIGMGLKRVIDNKLEQGDLMSVDLVPVRISVVLLSSLRKVQARAE